MWTQEHVTAGRGLGGQSSSRCQGEGRKFESRLPLQRNTHVRHSSEGACCVYRRLFRQCCTPAWRWPLSPSGRTIVRRLRRSTITHIRSRPATHMLRGCSGGSSTDGLDPFACSATCRFCGDRPVWGWPADEIALCRREPVDDCGDASVGVRLFGEVEFGEDRSYVCFELPVIFGSLPGPFMMFTVGEQGIEDLLPLLRVLVQRGCVRVWLRA